MRQVILASLVALMLVTGVAAQQSKPNFSGTWTLDRKKSNVQELVPDRPLRIKHTDPEFRYTSLIETNGQTKTGQEFVYYTDGRGEKNVAISFITSQQSPSSKQDLTGQTESKTKWHGNAIVTTAVLRINVAGYTLDFNMVDEWKISADGQTLTQTTKLVYLGGTGQGTFVPANRPDTKKVYNRISN